MSCSFLVEAVKAGVDFELQKLGGLGWHWLPCRAVTAWVLRLSPSSFQTDGDPEAFTVRQGSPGKAGAKAQPLISSRPEGQSSPSLGGVGRESQQAPRQPPHGLDSGVWRPVPLGLGDTLICGAKAFVRASGPLGVPPALCWGTGAAGRRRVLGQGNCSWGLLATDPCRSADSPKPFAREREPQGSGEGGNPRLPRPRACRQDGTVAPALSLAQASWV